jgi:hypothetical protein
MEAIADAFGKVRRSRSEARACERDERKKGRPVQKENKCKKHPDCPRPPACFSSLAHGEGRGAAPRTPSDTGCERGIRGQGANAIASAEQASASTDLEIKRTRKLHRSTAAHGRSRRAAGAHAARTGLSSARSGRARGGCCRAQRQASDSSSQPT